MVLLIVPCHLVDHDADPLLDDRTVKAEFCANDWINEQRRTTVLKHPSFKPAGLQPRHGSPGRPGKLFGRNEKARRAATREGARGTTDAADTAQQVLGRAGVTPETATFLPQAGTEAARALAAREADVVWTLGAAEAAAVQSLLRQDGVRLLDFPMAEAFSRIFPSVVRLVLPQGVIDIDRQIPASDTTLIATTNRVLVRSELHPAIVALLLQTMVAVHREPSIFAAAGEFPKSIDPDYPVAASAVDFYKNGPSFLERHLPLWLTVHAHRAIAAVVTGIAIGFPLFRYLPLAYRWTRRRRLFYWYERLKSLEASLDSASTENELAEKRSEIDRIEDAVSRIRFPLSLADQVYMIFAGI